MEARYPSESDFQQEVVRKLERYNWDVQTEVRSDCGSYRVDMIIEHRCVEPIGLELKNLGGLSSKKLVGGIKQALQYREATYNGESIELWGVAFHFRQKSRLSKPSSCEVSQTTLDSVSPISPSLGTSILVMVTLYL